ncbi:hypothetical protein E2562_001137 [Oryza meyeriana var. granulata]|uniref:BZIP domain-containing protein n=1 Tax=Oryza meyeriana var. granulata TaxID=110450 RepID=A0A6G1EDC4_9ORYZ|nr:hypothetical protein E2562_001137 [Oryza meyeriana var. granulata]
MAEPALLDPSPFDHRHYPAHLFDPDLPLSGGGGDDDLPLGAFDGLDFDLLGDFSVEDFLLRSPDRDDSGEGSAAGSGPTASPSSSPTTSASNSAVANGSCEVKHEESDEGRSGADPKWSLKRKQASPGLSSDAAKCRRSGDGDVSPSASASRTAVDSDEGGTVCEEEDKRRAARLMRNRESAQLSRQRKKRYVEELEEKVKSMHSVINDLNSRISFVMAENATLRQQLSGSSANCPPPGVYPPPPIPGMHFPWVPGGRSDNAMLRNFGQSHARVLSVSSQDKSGLNNSDMIGVDVGPILNSGMCSEVFQFDISTASSNPGGIIPASPVVNSSSVNATEKIPAHSAAYHGKLKNRRVMYNEAIPLTGKTGNNTEPFNRTSESSKLPDSQPASSVVVSVLADPREADMSLTPARFLSRVPAHIL